MNSNIRMTLFSLLVFTVGSLIHLSPAKACSLYSKITSCKHAHDIYKSAIRNITRSKSAILQTDAQLKYYGDKGTCDAALKGIQNCLTRTARRTMFQHAVLDTGNSCDNNHLYRAIYFCSEVVESNIDKRRMEEPHICISKFSRWTSIRKLALKRDQAGKYLSKHCSQGYN